MRLLILATLALLLAACATGRDPNYTAYLEARQAAQSQEAATLRAISDASASCGGDATCVVAVAGFAALATRQQGAGGSLQQYVRQPSAGERIGLALIGQISPLASAAVSWRASDNSRDIALGQYDFLGGVVGSLATSPALAHPSISVGGDYVSGQQHIGDAIGRDSIGGNQHLGDAIGRDAIGGNQHVGDAIGRDAIGGNQHVGDAIGRDVIGRDAIGGNQHLGDAIGRDAIGRDQRIGPEINIGGNDNSGNSGRIGSPGPWDIDNGDRCSGPRCQGAGDDFPPPAAPAPTPEPEPVP